MTRAYIDHPGLAFLDDPNRACLHRTDLDWYPERGAHIARLRAVCATCPQLAPCREWANGDQPAAEELERWERLANHDHSRRTA